jgi:hypothetical protein
MGESYAPRPSSVVVGLFGSGAFRRDEESSIYSRIESFSCQPKGQRRHVRDTPGGLEPPCRGSGARCWRGGSDEIHVNRVELFTAERLHSRHMTSRLQRRL